MVRRSLICRKSTTWGYSSTCECWRRAFLTTPLRVGSGRSSQGCWSVRPRSSAGRGTRSVSGPPFNEQVDAFPPRAGGWRSRAPDSPCSWPGAAVIDTEVDFIQDMLHRHGAICAIACVPAVLAAERSAVSLTADSARLASCSSCAKVRRAMLEMLRAARR